MSKEDIYNNSDQSNEAAQDSFDLCNSTKNDISETLTNNTLEVSFTIIKVSMGCGNAGHNRGYEYGYVPEDIVLTPSITQLQVKFSDKIKMSYKMIGYAKEDTGGTSIIVTKHTAADKRSILIPSKYAKGESYFLTIVILDERDPGEKIYCDPQVRNSPPPN